MALADEVINNAITEGDFPGAVLCIVSRAADGASMGDVLYLKAYGNRQVVSGATADGEYIADTIAMTTDAVFLGKQMCRHNSVGYASGRGWQTTHR